VGIPEILIIVGIIVLIGSFFIRNDSRQYENELEKVSISLHQEVSGLKKRLRTIEDELMISVQPIPGKKEHFQKKPIHDIIVNQILALHAQGYSINDIAIRASLSKNDVLSVLRSKGESV
jgi:hypothetical protein